MSFGAPGTSGASSRPGSSQEGSSQGGSSQGGSSQGGPSRLGADAPCPCGSEERFGECCRPVLEGTPAASALALMRSRYTAHALGADDHLAATWHPGTRPDAVVSDEGLQWTRLEIVETADGMPGDRRGIVAFRAHWRDARGATGVLAERSRFVWQSGTWWYLDGRTD